MELAFPSMPASGGEMPPAGRRPSRKADTAGWASGHPTLGTTWAGAQHGALAMRIGELFADKMKTAPDRTAFLGLLARVMSAGIAGAALAPGAVSVPEQRSRSQAPYRLPTSRSPAANGPWRAWVRPGAD